MSKCEKCKECEHCFFDKAEQIYKCNYYKYFSFKVDADSKACIEGKQKESNDE